VIKKITQTRKGKTVTRKYEFTGEEKQIFDRTLKRVRRISDGLVGGWIEKEYNLSHDGNCFIFDNACVYGDARVFGAARVFGDACVYDNAYVYDDGLVFGNARVFGYACVFGKARVCDNASVYDNACVYGDASVCDNARVSGKARVYDNACVFGDMLCTESVMYANLYRYIITCSDSHISVGCQVHTFEVWKEHGEKIAKEEGLSDTEIELYRSIILGMIAYREATNQKG
jgi:hypothetical protein